MQADYYWKDFSFGIYGRTCSKVMDSDLICVTTPAKYGISASWSYNGWYIEAGAENPFTKHSDYEYSLNTDVYGYRKTLSSRTNQQTGYQRILFTARRYMAQPCIARIMGRCHDHCAGHSIDYR